MTDRAPEEQMAVADFSERVSLLQGCEPWKATCTLCLSAHAKHQYTKRTQWQFYFFKKNLKLGGGLGEDSGKNCRGRMLNIIKLHCTHV